MPMMQTTHANNYDRSRRVSMMDRVVESNMALGDDGTGEEELMDLPVEIPDQTCKTMPTKLARMIQMPSDAR